MPDDEDKNSPKIITLRTFFAISCTSVAPFQLNDDEDDDIIEIRQQFCSDVKFHQSLLRTKSAVCLLFTCQVSWEKPTVKKTVFNWQLTNEKAI